MQAEVLTKQMGVEAFEIVQPSLYPEQSISEVGVGALLQDLSTQVV